MIRSIHRIANPNPLPYLNLLLSASKTNTASKNIIEKQLNFGEYAFTEQLPHNKIITPEELDHHAKTIFEWAKSKGA
jgi:hypothetical protein